jgi:hypothetical protein
MRSLIAALLFSALLHAQDSALTRLKQELKAAREQSASDEKQAMEAVRATGKWPEGMEGRNAARMVRVHAALLNFLEARLPNGPSAAAIKSADWEASMRKQLASAGIGEKSAPDSAAGPEPLPLDNPGFDSLSVSLDWKAELPDMLLIAAGVAVRCGEDQATYAYRFDANGWARIISDHLESDFGSGAGFELSGPDPQGRRLLLIDRGSVQCASAWSGMQYSVYRISPSRPPESLISSDHSFWWGNDHWPAVVLSSDELMIELQDSSVDVGVHNRTQIYHYSFVDGVKRLEPFALQPQDFAEEWLTRPWSEMQSRSSPETQKWHAKLHADFVIGEYSKVALCSARPDRWSIGFSLTHIGERELKEPLEVHLLVRDLGNYRFEMEAVSDSEFEGCPGEGSPSDKHPWLSLEQLKALP